MAGFMNSLKNKSSSNFYNVAVILLNADEGGRMAGLIITHATQTKEYKKIKKNKDC